MRSVYRLLAAAALTVAVLAVTPTVSDSDPCTYSYQAGECTYYHDYCAGSCVFVCPYYDGRCD